MSFHNPGILWGLLAILIPIIIHLFNFRKVRKVYFPTLDFLKEIIRKNQRKSDLKHLLVLASRILAIAALVIGFAGPYLKDKNQALDLSGDRIVSIYLDNSFSMQAGTSFEANFLKAKEQVRKLAESLPQSTRYQFVSNDLKPGSSLILSKDDLIEELHQLQISAINHSVSSMIAVQQNQMPASARDKAVYFLVSDFQHIGNATEENVKQDTSGQYLFVPVGSGSSIANLSIDSAWFESPVRQLGAVNDLKVMVSNRSGQDMEKVSIRLFIDGTQTTAMAIDLPANGSTPLSMPVNLKKEGFQTARLELSDYPLVFDDVFEMAWHTSRSRSISHIFADGSGGYVQRLFGPDSNFALSSFKEGQIDFDFIRRSDFIILENLKDISSGLASELDNYLKDGGSVLLFPPYKGSVDSYNQWLSKFGLSFGNPDTSRAGIDRVNLQHPLLQEVFEKSPDKMDLPAVFYSYPIISSANSAQTILHYRIDRPFLSDLSVGPGHLYLCASPLNELASSLPKHSLFVYLTLNMALKAGGSQAIGHTLHQGLIVPLGDLRFEADQVPILKQLESDKTFIPEVMRNERGVSLLMRHSLPQAGIYELMKGEERMSVLAFNNSRTESENSFTGLAQLRDWTGKDLPLSKSFVLDTEKLPIDASLKEVREGRGFEIWFIIAALILLLGEAILLRWL